MKSRLIATLVLLTLSKVGSAGVLCRDGTGAFQAALSTGVQVTVGPEISEGLAGRACGATLVSGPNKQVIVDHASQVDLDMFGVDLNDAGPVAAFQIKESEDECCMTYRIYSLKNVPRLLRTLTRGFFHGADTDLDGKVEIWATDAAVLDRLDGLTAEEMEFPPTYVLRLEHGRLLDANSEFRSYFDDVIGKIRAKIDPAQLHDFRLSDGLLQPRSDSEAARMDKLRPVKTQVLELVCAYLYSGREKEAWKNLGSMWPEADVARIQSAIADAYVHGIMTQLDGVSKVAETSSLTIKRVPIYPTPAHPEVQKPRAIVMWVPDSISLPRVTDNEATLDLVIDSAGKVQSVTAVSLPDGYQELPAIAKEWKFVPAFLDGHSVASHFREIVSPKR